MKDQASDIMFSFVAPVYNEAKGLEQFYQRLKTVAEGLGENYEIILVNDGSTDSSLEIIRSLAERDSAVRYVDFSRNFGHQAAVTAGYDYACGRAVISLNSDCQHPPEIIPQLVEKWHCGAEVVYTIRTDPDAVSGARRWLGRCLYRAIARVSGMDLIDQADFRLLDRKAVLALRGLREQARFVRGLVRWIGFKQASHPYKAQGRQAGASGYSWRQLSGMAMAGLLNFSLVPLRAVGAMGALMLLAGVLYLAIAGVLALLGLAPFSGLAMLLLTVGGLQLTCLAAVGEYVGRIYEQSKGRPLYIVRHARGFELDEEMDAIEPPSRQSEDDSHFSVMT